MHVYLCSKMGFRMFPGSVCSDGFCQPVFSRWENCKRLKVWIPRLETVDGNRKDFYQAVNIQFRFTGLSEWLWCWAVIGGSVRESFCRKFRKSFLNRKRKRFQILAIILSVPEKLFPTADCSEPFIMSARYSHIHCGGAVVTYLRFYSCR